MGKSRTRGKRLQHSLFVTGGCSGEDASLFSQVSYNKMRRNGLKLHQEIIRLDIKENFFMESMVS